MGKSVKICQPQYFTGTDVTHLIVLPREQRVRLIGQDLAEHGSLITRELSALLEDIVRRQCHDTPSDIVVMLDRGSVDIFCGCQFLYWESSRWIWRRTLESGPSNSAGTHGARFSIRVDRQFSPSSVNLRSCHVLGSEDSCACIDCWDLAVNTADVSARKVTCGKKTRTSVRGISSSEVSTLADYCICCVIDNDSSICCKGTRSTLLIESFVCLGHLSVTVHR